MHPTLNEIRELSKKYKLKKCILAFELPDGRFGFISYGHNKEQCQKTKKIGDKLYDLFESELVKENA